MKIIKVLGSGCAKCSKTADIISATAAELKVDVEVLKETSELWCDEYPRYRRRRAAGSFGVDS